MVLGSQWRQGCGPPASVTDPLCSLGPVLPDWAIVLITITVVAAIASALYGVKKVSDCGPNAAGLDLVPRTLTRARALGRRVTAATCREE